MPRHVAMFCLAVGALLAQGVRAVNVDFGSGPSTPEETIDAAAQRAELIVRGTVVNSVGHPEASDDTVAVRVTLHVNETLKGPRTDRCVFRVRVSELKYACGDWLESGGKSEALFFLVSEAKPEVSVASAPSANAVPFVVLQRAPWYGLWAFRLPSTLDRGPRPVDVFGIRYDADDALVAAIRDAVDAKLVSSELIEFSLSTGPRPAYSDHVIAPVTSRLEAQARRWLREGNEVESALRVLRHFPCDENASLILPLLNDTVFVRDSTDKWDLRAYPVRQEVYDVLRSFGRDVPPP